MMFMPFSRENRLESLSTLKAVTLFNEPRGTLLFPRLLPGLPPPTMALRYNSGCTSTTGKGLPEHKDCRGQTIIKGG